MGEILVMIAISVAIQAQVVWHRAQLLPARAARPGPRTRRRSCP